MIFVYGIPQLDWGIHRKDRFGACPVFDTGGKPENDNHWNKVFYD
jgi:hypothetical protein